MALHYVGHRPVVKERFLGEAVNPYTGETEKYSNYQLFNTANVLDGAPNKVHEPEVYNKQTPLDRAGEAPRAFGYDFKHLEYHGVEGDAPLRGSFGHEFKIKSQLLHDDKIDNPLARTFGTPLEERDWLDPNDPGKMDTGVANALKSDSYGEPVPEGNDSVYGHNKINQWNGVKGDKAIF